METKVMRISKQPSRIQIMIQPQKLENVKYFCYLGSMITNNARCTHEIKPTIAMEKAVFNKNNSFHQQIGLKLQEDTSKVLHLEHRFVWC
jgi:hypothetical protein